MRVEGGSSSARSCRPVVGAVMFLSSPASDFMTGQTLNVDGGKMMH